MWELAPSPRCQSESQCLSAGFVVQVAEPWSPVRGGAPVPVPELQTQEDAICGAAQPQHDHREPAHVSGGVGLPQGTWNPGIVPWELPQSHLKSWGSPQSFSCKSEIPLACEL